MSFWDSLWSGIKFAGKTAWSIIESGINIVTAAASGFASGGPIGAAALGAVAAVSNISTSVDRIKGAYDQMETELHPSSSQSQPQESDPTSAPTINMMTHPAVRTTNALGTANTMTRVLDNVDSSSPDTVKNFAVSSARFHDSLAKTNGDIVASVKAAGGTPITSALSQGMSQAVVNHINSKTGFNGSLARRFDPVSAAMSMTPSTSAYSNVINKHLSGSGAESLALSNYNKRLNLPPPSPFMIGAGA